MLEVFLTFNLFGESISVGFKIYLFEIIPDWLSLNAGGHLIY